MTDLLIKLNQNPTTSWLTKAVGLPNPTPLTRQSGANSERILEGQTAVLTSAPNSYAVTSLQKALNASGATLIDYDPAALTDGSKVDVVVMDATGCISPDDYQHLYSVFHLLGRKIAKNGRVLITAACPEEADTVSAAAIARGVEGFSRTLAKELGKKGITVNMVYVPKDSTDRLEGVMRFFCSKATAYVTGQAVTLSKQVSVPKTLPFKQSLKNKVALVTGSARGIGYATAQRLVAEGATVVCLDIPAMAEELEKSSAAIGASALALDISADNAPTVLARYFKEKHGGIDIVVHNAGITRDKTIANMEPHLWDQVVSVNLSSILKIDEVLLAEKVLRDEGRLVYLSSVSGVAGNFGQTNYAATKAALIGYVKAQAPVLASRGICANAIAPGFIDTPMTEAMPFITREVGSRLNSVLQSGKPGDAAELITFLCTPGAYGLSGNTIRVCGQGLIGA